MSANVKLIWSDLGLALKGPSGVQGWHFGLHEIDALSLSGGGVAAFRLLAETPAMVGQTQTNSGTCALEVSGEKLRLAGGGTGNGGDGRVIPSTATDCAEARQALNARSLVFKIALAPFCYCSAKRFIVGTIKGYKIFYSKQLLVYILAPLLRRASL